MPAQANPRDGRRGLMHFPAPRARQRWDELVANDRELEATAFAHGASELQSNGGDDFAGFVVDVATVIHGQSLSVGGVQRGGAYHTRRCGWRLDAVEC
jgi:hypothetical protein